MKRILIVANVSSFLYKFERGDVRILQSLGHEVHYAANMREQHHEAEAQVMEQMGVIMHHIDIARSPYLYHDNRTALAQLLRLIERLDIRVLHCHTPVGGVLGRLAGKLASHPLYVLYTAHGFHFYRGAPLLNNTLYYLAERALAAYTDVLITINEEDYVPGPETEAERQRMADPRRRPGHVSFHRDAGHGTAALPPRSADQRRMPSGRFGRRAQWQQEP